MSSALSPPPFVVPFDHLVSGPPVYFVIEESSHRRQWTNGAENIVSWFSGLLDGIIRFEYRDRLDEPIWLGRKER